MKRFLILVLPNIDMKYIPDPLTNEAAVMQDNDGQNKYFWTSVLVGPLKKNFGILLKNEIGVLEVLRYRKHLNWLNSIRMCRNNCTVGN